MTKLRIKKRSNPNYSHYAELKDPEDGHSWLFEINFLLSNWECIFLKGCKGVLDFDAESLCQGCCSFGAHFTGIEDLNRVARACEKLNEANFENYDYYLEKGFYKGSENAGFKTRIKNGKCIFLNSPNFKAGPGCALHQLAIKNKAKPFEYKPDVCWQLPIRKEDLRGPEGAITTVIRSWTRKDWGEGGSYFYWFCTDTKDAYSSKQPVYKSLATELKILIGDELYEQLVKVIETR